MDLFLGLLPLLALACLFILFTFDKESNQSRIKAYIRATLVCGVFLSWITEILSIFSAINQLSLVFAWLIFAVGSIWVYRKRFNSIELPSIFKISLSSKLEKWMAFELIIILTITAIVAWLSPPQTWDSLNYHMARVAHWAQNGSIQHFATGIEVQNVISPGAEIGILHIYVLSQSDRLVNFVQWWAMLSSGIAAVGLFTNLGGNSEKKLLAGLISATIPMGIIQASSTVNDYILSYWILAAAIEAIEIYKTKKQWPNLNYAGIAAGLAVWTKPTAIAYLIPLGLIILYRIISLMISKRRISKTFLLHLITSAVLFGSINAGYWFRNIITFGNPFSDPVRQSTHQNELFSPAGIISNLTRNIAFHTGLPWGRANKLIYETVVEIHEYLGISIEDSRTTSIGPYPWMAIRTNEESSGNTFHALLIVSCLALLIWRRRDFPPVIGLAALTIGSTMVIFSAIFKWQIYGSRYHLPFFVLFSPIIAIIFSTVLSKKWVFVLSVLLLVSSLPWLFSIESRPIIPIDSSPIESIFTASELDIRFANSQYQIEEYQAITNAILNNKCDRIGVLLGGIQTEYHLWYLLGFPRQDKKLEWIVTGTPSEIYRDPQFHACAVICEDCVGPGTDVFGDLVAVYEGDIFKLYLTKQQGIE